MRELFQLSFGQLLAAMVESDQLAMVPVHHMWKGRQLQLHAFYNANAKKKEKDPEKILPLSFLTSEKVKKTKKAKKKITAEQHKRAIEFFEKLDQSKHASKGRTD